MKRLIFTIALVLFGLSLAGCNVEYHRYHHRPGPVVITRPVHRHGHHHHHHRHPYHGPRRRHP